MRSADFVLPVVGYTVMRLSLLSQWLRPARAHPEGRATAMRYVVGIVVIQSAWIGWLFMPVGSRMPLFALLALFDLAVPIWAESAARTAWHPHHIAERYGLFTLIVLGESVLAATTAVQHAVGAGEATGDLYTVAAGGLLIVLSLWWLYFAKPAERFLNSSRAAFVWGYGHYLVFGSAAAIGAGLAVNVDHATHHTQISGAAAGASVTIPVAVFLLVVYLLHIRPQHAFALHALLVPGTAVVVLALTFTSVPVLATGLAVAALVAASVAIAERREPHPSPASRAV